MNDDYHGYDDDSATGPAEWPKFALFPKQQQAIDYLTNPSWSGVNVVMYGGSIRSAKSVSACALIIHLAHSYPGVRMMVIRKSFKLLELNFVPKLIEVFGLMYGQDAQSTWERGAHGELKWANGSSLILQGMDINTDENFHKLRGWEGALVVLEESQELDDGSIVGAVGGRLSKLTGYHTDGSPWQLYPKILITSNPTPITHWTHRDFWLPYTTDTLPPYRRVVLAYPWDNPTLSESWHTMQRQNMDPRELQVNYYGDWSYVVEQSPLFDPVALKSCFRSATTYGQRSFITIDPATDHGKDHTVITIWSDWHCHTILMSPTWSSQDIVAKVNELQRQYQCDPQRTICDANGVGYAIAQQLGCVPFMAGAGALNGEPYQHMKSQMYYRLADRMAKGVCSIGVTDPKVQGMIIEECQAHRAVDQYKEAKNKVSTKDEVRSRIKRSPDISDALSYRAYFDYIADDFDLDFF